RNSQYGYSLIKTLESKGISIEGNTLYPLLRRLEEQALLTSEWDTELGSKPRKYYHTTNKGEQVLKELKAIWYETVNNMDDILGGGYNESSIDRGLYRRSN
ncbi:MAG: PadR family transcriptional regulator, partial [Candidatus Izimaplasma sp.]|nr:PadR family transcriptional regulator [Candidatus Izimaplasma bacterium]